MIVAVEGPSAAGKTTWCARQPFPTVAEYAPTGHEPDGSDESRRAAHWVRVATGRWRQAREAECHGAVVLCDSDPLKLHYAWCLARVGAGSWSRFEHELAGVRSAVAAGRLGLADLVLVSIPSLDELRRRREGDPTRRRRSFELHASLREPLREWYSAVEAADPGRVVWRLPETGVPEHAPRAREDPGLLDRVLAGLPGPGRGRGGSGGVPRPL